MRFLGAVGLPLLADRGNGEELSIRLTRSESLELNAAALVSYKGSIKAGEEATRQSEETKKGDEGVCVKEKERENLVLTGRLNLNPVGIVLVGLADTKESSQLVGGFLKRNIRTTKGTRINTMRGNRERQKGGGEREKK